LHCHLFSPWPSSLGGSHYDSKSCRSKVLSSFVAEVPHTAFAIPLNERFVSFSYLFIQCFYASVDLWLFVFWVVLICCPGCSNSGHWELCQHLLWLWQIPIIVDLVCGVG
jgi:hypothetical protein